MKRQMTPDQLRAKVEWSGGVYLALEYGVLGETTDPELNARLKRARATWRKFRAQERKVAAALWPEEGE